MSEEPVMNPSLPTRGRLIGVDHGKVRVGLAICDMDQRLASPLATYTRRNETDDRRHFIKIASAECVVGWVVGLPLHMNGEEGTQAAICRQYGAWLGSVTQLPVIYIDERCTTSAAEDALWNAGLSHQKRKDRRDQIAATLVLQTYLDMKHLQDVAATSGE